MGAIQSDAQYAVNSTNRWRLSRWRQRNSATGVLAFLEKHPDLRDRFASIVSAVENSEGNLKEADAAEERIIEEMRLLGREAMQGWAERQVEVTEREIRQQLRFIAKVKKLRWHSKLGDIAVLAACRTQSFQILGIVENGRFRLPWRFDLAAVAPVDPRQASIYSCPSRSGAAAGLPAPFQAWARTNIRFKFQAIVTRLHSPRTLSSPRSENCRNPSTDLMMPNTGSGVCLRSA